MEFSTSFNKIITMTTLVHLTKMTNYGFLLWESHANTKQMEFLQAHVKIVSKSQNIILDYNKFTGKHKIYIFCIHIKETVLKQVKLSIFMRKPNSSVFECPFFKMIFFANLVMKTFA